MKAIKKSFCFVLAALAAAFTAHAVDPVAVWSGGFDVTEKSGLTLNLNGNTRADDNSYIEITGNNGVMVSGGNASHSTVLIKYSNLDWSNAGSGKVISLLTHKCGAKTEDNCTGIAVASDGVLHGIWVNNKWSNTTGGPLVAPSDASAKVSLACTFVSASALNDEGTRVFYKNENGSVSQVYDASGLKGTKDNTVTTDWSIGGHYGTSTGTNVKTSAAGMKIYGIAIFDKRLTQSEIEEYEFPSSDVETIVLTNDDGSGSLGGVGNYQPDALLIPDSSGIEAGKIVTVKSVTFALDSSAAANANWISINGVQSSSKTISGTWPNTAYPLVTYNYGDGVDIEIGKSAPMVASGDSRWRLFANVTDADRQYIGMTNTTDMNKGYRPAYKIVLEVPIGDVKNPSKAEITTNTAWADLDWDAKPTASDKAELTVSANATLTFDSTTAYQSLKLIGQRDLTIVGITSSNIGLVSKIKTTSFTGKLTFEIDASAGLTADDALKNLIKSASGKVAFAFKSTVQNKGATIDFGNWNGTLGTHLAFIGGAHTFKWQNGSGSGGETKFGANGSVDNPTIWVKNGATLDFYGKDISGWHCAADMNGVLKVDNGARLNLKDNGGTFFFSAKLYLEPGSETHVFTTGQNLRFNGGYDVNKQQLYVPASEGGVAKIVIESNASINIGQENNPNAAAFVGAGSTLRIEGAFGAVNSSRELAKYGEGKLEITGNVSPKLIINAGSIGLGGTVNDLTLANSAAINLDNGAPTVTGTLTCSPAKQLLLTIAEPVHMMPVVTLPAAADKAGWTAVVNGNTGNPCELIAEGNTLKLKWKIPPTIEIDADDVTIEVADDWNGGVVTVGLDSLNVGDYEGDIRYLLRFGDKVVVGSVKDASASFELGASDFTAGNIYRGTFELEYGEGNPAVVAAEVTVYAGEKTYGMQEGWINETTKTFASTGSYDPEQGATFDDSFIKFSNPTDVVFTPTNSPADYVAKCDSEVTFEIFSGEEAIPDDDDTVADDIQAGVRIVDDGNDGVKFQFISGDEWIDGPAAMLNTTYAVTVNFHYAKDETDADSVTYTVKDLTQEPIVANRRANTAEKLETISFAGGTQIASLTGTCQIEVADPVAKGMAPGDAPKIIVAENDEDAQAQANAIPILIPDDEEVKAALDTDEKRNRYKKILKVVAVKDGNQYKATVVLMPAEETIQKELQEKNDAILVAVAEKLGALLDSGDEGTLTGITGEPGLFYGVAADGNLVSIGMASQDELLDKVDSDNWKIAGSDGTITGLKVTKPANAKQRFYKIICSPTPKSSTK